MKLFSYTIVLLALIITSCQPIGEESGTGVNESNPFRTQEYLMASTLFVQNSAEYEVLCYQAFNLAASRLTELMESEPENPAIVLDVDETVLDNSAYSAWQVANDRPFEKETWAQWTALANAPAVPGVSEFLKLADSLGVHIFYVSNRDSAALEATMKNMRDLGLPQVSPDRFMLKTTTSDKSERRVHIEEQGYDILLFIGDSLGDFHERWDKGTPRERSADAADFQKVFGDRYIMLPNPIYGSWEGALYNFDRSWDDVQRDSLRRGWLNPAQIEG